jgi:hypothetical protein
LKNSIFSKENLKLAACVLQSKKSRANLQNLSRAKSLNRNFAAQKRKARQKSKLFAACQIRKLAALKMSEVSGAI